MAVAARAAAANQVFTPEGVLLKPTDSHYYVRFAELQRAVFPRFETFDPWVNFPDGAQILWPPLHTWWVALHIQFAPAFPEAAAAWVGITSTLLWFPAIAAYTKKLLGTEVALITLAVLALLPAVVESSVVGNADHHVHEPYLALTLALLVVHVASKPEQTKVAIALGALLATSRLLTTGTVVLLPCVAAALFACNALPSETRRALAKSTVIAGATSATLSAAYALAFGDLLSLEFVTLSGFLPLASIAAFGLVAFTLSLDRERARVRVDPFAYAAIPAVFALAVIVKHAISMRAQLTGEDPLLRVVVESQPIWSTPHVHIVVLGGLGVAAIVALIALAGEAARTRAPETIVFAAVTLLLAVAFILQLRFVQSLAGPLAATIALGHLSLSTRFGERRGKVLWAVLALALLWQFPAMMPKPTVTVLSDEALARPTMNWLRDHTPSPPDYAVLATHDLGHLLTLWAKRPNVSSPFSQAPWHLAGNARASAMLAATDDETAYQSALATKARYVVVVPFAVILGRDGSKDDATMARKLLEHAAMQGEGTAHFRLIHESAEQRLRVEKGPYARVFEVVPGAVLAGAAPPGAPVTATLELTTNTGAKLQYRRQTIADANGGYSLRLAYPSDATAEVRASGPYRVQIGTHATAEVAISETQVLSGAEFRLP